jgi:hypothetical protein
VRLNGRVPEPVQREIEEILDSIADVISDRKPEYEDMLDLLHEIAGRLSVILYEDDETEPSEGRKV